MDLGTCDQRARFHTVISAIGRPIAEFGDQTRLLGEREGYG